MCVNCITFFLRAAAILKTSRNTSTVSTKYLAETSSCDCQAKDDVTRNCKYRKVYDLGRKKRTDDVSDYLWGAKLKIPHMGF